MISNNDLLTPQLWNVMWMVWHRQIKTVQGAEGIFYINKFLSWDSIDQYVLLYLQLFDRALELLACTIQDCADIMGIKISHTEQKTIYAPILLSNPQRLIPKLLELINKFRNLSRFHLSSHLEAPFWENPMLTIGGGR